MPGLRVRIRTLATMPVFQRREQAPTRATVAPPGPRRLELIALTSGPGGIASVIGLVTQIPSTLTKEIVLYMTRLFAFNDGWEGDGMRYRITVP